MLLNRRNSTGDFSFKMLRVSKLSRIPRPMPAASANHVLVRLSATKDKIGTYKFIQTLGRGSYSIVKLATHIPTGKDVAIKVLDKSDMGNDLLHKPYREMRIMKMLNHPNIVQLYQVVETEKKLYFIMEDASGGELIDYIQKQGRLSESEARIMFRQTVSAVQYCHQKGIVHRDLKTENLLLDSELNIKIADFGFSNEFTPGSKLDTFCGSPSYTAPELFEGIQYDGPKVDAWSLGVLLYEFVTGSLPFKGAIPIVRQHVLSGQYKIPFYLSTECECLLRKILVVNPEKRATIDAIMCDEWMNIGLTGKDDELKPYVEPKQDLADPKRIAALVTMGYNRQEIENSLTKRCHDEIFAAYFLVDCKQLDINLYKILLNGINNNLKYMKYVFIFLLCSYLINALFF